MHLFQPEADIHLNYLKQNYLTIKKMVGAAKVMAVVKANAYGHGGGSICLFYTSPSPRDREEARMPSSAWKKKQRQSE